MFKKRGIRQLANRSRIVHLALKVSDLERATQFYEDVFGFRQTGTGHARGHVSRHMTDGAFDLALMVYDSEDVHEAQLSGPGPCIHHWGIEVADREATIGAIEAHGGAIISDPDEGALKFRASDGTVAEIVRAGRYRKASGDDRARIQGLSIVTPDPTRASLFYRSVFGFDESPGVEAQLTDGAFRISLLRTSPSGRPVHHHWSIGVSNIASFGNAIEQHGGVRVPEEAEFMYRTPDASLLHLISL
jgi:lactoylglutathione lyase